MDLDTIKDFALLFGVFFVGGFLGYMINESLGGYEQKFEGAWFEGDYNHAEALEHVKGYDEGGNWICVNVRNMKPERAIEVCNHEAGHEIFATACENNITKCLNAVD